MIELKNITKTYTTKKGLTVKALDDVSIKFEDKGMVFILGKSGSGKSTMLNLLGGLDRYDSGEIIIKGKSSKDFTQSEFDSYRNTYLGFIFQEYNILPEFTVGANIALAMELQGRKSTEEELNKLLDEVDLAGHAGRKPNELSGGQKQRVAIARALIKNPDIILADEPTGALDSKTGKQVFETLQKLSKTKLVIIVSHDREFAEYYGDRVIELSDGKVVSDILKYQSQGKSLNESVSVIDDKIIHIKKGYHLTEEDLKLINDYIAKSDDDTLISLDKATNTDFKKFARLDDSGNRQAFKATEEEDIKLTSYTPSDFKLIKSKLPIKNMIKIGANSLKVKPFRLFFTILLAAIALTFFGVADTLASYDKSTAIVSSIMDNKANYVSLSKYKTVKQHNWENIMGQRMTDEDMNFLYEKTKLNFTPVKTISNSSKLLSTKNFKDSGFASKGYYYKMTLGGLMELESSRLGDLGFALVGNSVFPTASNEVLITEYIFQHYKAGGWRNPQNQDETYDIKTENDIIGKTIILNEQIYTISGIVETNMDYEHFESLKSQDSGNNMMGNVTQYLLSAELASGVMSGPHGLIFAKEGFSEDNPLLFDNEDYTSTGFINYYFESNDNNYDNFLYIQKLKKAENLTSVTYLGGYTVDNLKQDDIIADITTLIGIYNRLSTNGTLSIYDPIETIRATLDAESFPKIVIQSMDYASGETVRRNFNIAGYSESYSQNNAEESLYLSKENISYLAGAVESVNPYLFAISVMPKKRADIEDLVAFSNAKADGIYYQINDNTVLLLNNLSDIIEMLSKVFLYIGIGFAVFAAFLMMNFISTSISYKKHEIGILRAVGARSSDVFGIFLAESWIIALIEWVIAIVFTLSGTAIGNSMIRKETGFALTLLTVGIRQIALVLAISIFVAFVASLIPTWRISRKKPIDSINNR